MLIFLVRYENSEKTGNCIIAFFYSDYVSFLQINKLDKVTVTAMVYHFRKGGGEETKLLPEWTAEEVPHGTILRN